MLGINSLTLNVPLSFFSLTESSVNLSGCGGLVRVAACTCGSAVGAQEMGNLQVEV